MTSTQPTPARLPKPRMVPLGSLIAYERNARTHSDSQIKQLVAAIREFGFTNPVLIDEKNVILAGHGRVRAAQQIGMKRVPCLVLSHLNEAQKRAYVLADNRLAEKAGWDQDLLKLELVDLAAEGYDIELAGFSEKTLTTTLDTSQQIGPDMQYKIVVDCNDEKHQAKVLKKLEGEGLTCRPLIA